MRVKSKLRWWLVLCWWPETKHRAICLPYSHRDEGASLCLVFLLMELVVGLSCDTPFSDFRIPAGLTLADSDLYCPCYGSFHAQYANSPSYVKIFLTAPWELYPVTGCWDGRPTQQEVFFSQITLHFLLASLGSGKQCRCSVRTCLEFRSVCLPPISTLALPLFPSLFFETESTAFCLLINLRPKIQKKAPCPSFQMCLRDNSIFFS